MNLMTPLLDAIEQRCSKRTLARLSVVLVVVLVTSQIVLVWYVASMGLSMGAMAYSGDGRTVVIDAADHREFERHYSSDREEGWCLYGSANETHFRVTDVVHAQTLTKNENEVAFTCMPETAGQLTSGDDPRFIGIVHSHQTKNRSYLSRRDYMMWGRTSPFVRLMGVYTEPDGVAFFTTESMATSLETEIRNDTGTETP